MLWKKTVVMMAAFGALVLAAVVVAALPEGGGGPRLDIPKITGDEIVKIEIANAEGEDYSLVKEGENWTVTPVGKKADEKRIERAIKQVASLSAGNLVSKSPDSQSLYEVTDKALAVGVYGASGKSWKLYVGKRSSDERGDYVRKPDDDRVFICPGRLNSTFKNNMNYWRDRLLSKFEKDDAKALIIETEGKTLTFAKGDNAQWVFETPPADLPADYILDSEKVMRVVQAMSNMSASDFVDEPEADMGLNPPVTKATAALANGESVTLYAGNEKDKKFYAKKEGDDQIYLISKFQRDKLNQTATDLRDLHVAAFELDFAQSVEIDKGEEKIAFAKSGDKWSVKEYSGQFPDDFVLDPNKVESLARSASRLEGKSIVGKNAPAGAGLDKPKGVLKVTLSDGIEKTIKVGDEVDDKEIYVSGDEGYVFTVGKFNEKRLLKSIDEFKVSKAKPQTPRFSPDALKNLPPGVAEQLMKQQREKIMQQQLLKQMMDKAKKEEKDK